MSFIKNLCWRRVRFKEVAGIYGVTYLDRAPASDRLIQKIRLYEQADEEPHIALIKRLASRTSWI